MKKIAPEDHQWCRYYTAVEYNLLVRNGETCPHNPGPASQPATQPAEAPDAHGPTSMPPPWAALR